MVVIPNSFRDRVGFLPSLLVIWRPFRPNQSHWRRSQPFNRRIRIGRDPLRQIAQSKLREKARLRNPDAAEFARLLSSVGIEFGTQAPERIGLLNGGN